MSDRQWMQIAIDSARRGVEQGQTPFGAAIVRGDQLVAAAHNLVWQTTDITAHAEVNAIRQACGILGKIDLAGCVIYSTCEPCPMCFSACHWARLDRIVYGASIADSAAAGFHELAVSDMQLKQLGQSPIEITGEIAAEECRRLFTDWLARPDRRKY